MVWNGPGQLAAVQIPGAHIHGRPVRIIFFPLRSRDDQITKDYSRRGNVIRRLGKLLGDSWPQVHNALPAESRNKFPRFGVDGDQPPVARSGQYLGWSLLVALPVGDTAQWGGNRAAQIVFPDFFPSLWFERNDAVVDRGREEDAGGHNRHRFGRR